MYSSISCEGYCQSYQCQACNTIANCKSGRVRCTTSSNQYCDECQTGYAPVFRGSIANGKCQQQCSWQYDSKFCYPGSCSPNGPPSSCSCTSGYSGPNCLTIDTYNTVALSGTVTLSRDRDATASLTPVTSKAYIKEEGNVFLNMTWTAAFKASSSLPQAPSYVNQFVVGVIESVAKYTINSGRSIVENRNIESPTLTRYPPLSEDNPSEQETFVVTMYIDIGNNRIHGDRITVTAEGKNGGFISMMGPRKEYYSGNTASVSATFQVDLLDPYHCSTTTFCPRSNMLMVPSFTKEPRLQFMWSGWLDDDSGVQRYEVLVMPSKSEGGVIRCVQGDDVTKKCSGPSGCSVIVSDSGNYCVQLVVYDVTTNHNSSMRYVLFDNSSFVDVDHTGHNPLWIDSAESNTGFEWLTNIGDAYNHQRVLVKWPGHFRNEFHYHNGLLDRIDVSEFGIFEDYDHFTGQPPLLRSRESIPNINGIVGFKIAFGVDHEGGRTLTPESLVWSDVQNFMTQESELDIPMTDGDTVTVWVRALDVMGNEANDNVTFHVDSSPPIIEDIHLTKNGVSYLAVHHSADLFEMRAMFEAYDDHSGLHTIHWTLHDMADSNQVHGNGTVAVGKPSAKHPECDPPFCTCIPKGDCYFRTYEILLDYSKMNIPEGRHDYDYLFTITATNNAMLQTTSEFQVTVDTSPPHEGHVHDSRPGDPDVDFQQDFVIFASWDGFFDRESGILMYIYYFGETCLEDGNVTFPLISPLRNTTSTHAQWVAPSSGKYYCTVITYNKAMSPSKPVCSDGVVIDTTEPVIREVHIDDVYVRPRLIEDSNSTIWYVDKKRKRQRIENISRMCRDAVSTEMDIDLYPILVLDVNDTSLAVTDEECISLSNAPRGGFIRKENHLSLRWIGEDAESGIFDYEVGLSSASSGLDPDILPFTSTNAHADYLNYHPNLGEGDEFYVIIKATNRARFETTKFIGPLLVDVTPPVFNGDIVVSIERVNEGEEFLVARWNQDAFFDNDDSEPLTNYAIAVGDTEEGSSVMSFAPIDSLSSDLCRETMPPSCAEIATSLLNWHLHDQNVYYVSVKVENVAGLSVIGTSLAYRHVVLPPAAGVVYEISNQAENMLLGIPEDIDFQTSSTELFCQWFGFSHPYQDVTCSVALGTSPGLDDTVQFQVIGSSLSAHLFSSLALENYQKYYVSLRASTEVGNLTVSSDGIVVVKEDSILTDVDVYDGTACEATDGQRQNATHHDFVPRTECEADISFQASLNTVSSHWSVPDQLREFITHGQWALQKESEINSSYSIWNQVSDFQPTRIRNSFKATDLSLLPGHHYRSIVKFCHSAGCFLPVSSNGFWVIPKPPVPMGINEIVYENGTKELTFEWQRFLQQEMLAKQRDLQDPIDYYEWTLSLKTSEGYERHEDILFPWKQLNLTSGPSNALYRTTVHLPSVLTFTECVRLGLRGYNKVGLSSTIYKNIIDCEAVNPRLILPNIVIDAVGDYDGVNVRNVELADNAHWRHSDAEYTRSADKLSAVWPTLRNGRYEWKIVKDDWHGHGNHGMQQRTLEYSSYDCGKSEVLACGETKANFINAANLPLHHGYRYYVCVHANATVKVYEKSEVLLPETSACSDGIEVDQTPPTHGNVWIGSMKQRFQISTSELVLNWDGFSDVEEHGRTTHSSGIRKYDVAIGTSPGGVDVLDFDDVGITNLAVVHDLQLQGGRTYYATVRASDFVGLSSDVVSEGVTVDVTPPVKTDKSIDVGGAYLTSVSVISAKWNGVFEDQESGIDHYDWCIGARPGFADVVPCIVTMEPEINDANLNDLTLKEGYVYYITVTAYNGAGLSTTASSWGVIVDSSPPEHGMVYDGQSVEDDKDLDYQTHLDSLTARWKGFHEPHTDIVGYSWKIGTSPGYDDILEEEFVGLGTEMSADDLNLRPGVIYYATVTACNAAELCTTVSSDGIIADNSPPVAGIVYDGSSDGDHAYQASRTTISAHWFNFHDQHTQLSHYEWLAGTIPGGDDIMASTRLHLTEMTSSSQLQRPLPLNVPIYVTVRAYNKAGLFTEAASNGIIVDNSPPAIVKPARLDTTEGSIMPNTQIWRSTLRVSWAFSDPDSQIEHHRLSISTHHQSDMSVQPVKTTGGVHHHVFTNVSVHDGDEYSVKVIACNGAKLCTISESPGILVDSSPPSVGTFAVATDHAAGLSRHRQSSMTYVQGQGSETAKVNLAWLGFADMHSGISHYFVTLGTSFAARDLIDNQAVRIQYVSGNSHLDEGVVQTASISVTRDLHPGEHIYCALWAINGVGLRSYEAHETFVVVKSNNVSGVLSLLRRCDSQTCEGDCTCAPQNQLCHDSTVECNDVTGNEQYEQVDVVDI
ncbi:uncharacterized protein [Ptychodera flava]|uniref:uncharacterized protein n=1 Tax=Ptychodera flava TaxID=63121 RepID=UPI00396A6A37